MLKIIISSIVMNIKDIFGSLDIKIFRRKNCGLLYQSEDLKRIKAHNRSRNQ